MAAYYNEIDPYAAQWLRNLIAAGHIAPGDVDERSIEDVHPDDLRNYTQCHFFAGIGVWSYALRLAGWPDDRPVWTGSCPCQPFSEAGKGAGFDDERHLWPAWHWLIQERRPAVILGEQVASKNAEPWLDLVSSDLEALGFAVGAVAFPSAGIGAPHIRDRLYWVAVSHQGERGWRASNGASQRDWAKAGRNENASNSSGRGEIIRLANPKQHRSGCKARRPDHIGTEALRPADKHSRHSGSSDGMADTNHNEQRTRGIARSEGLARHESGTEPCGCGATDCLGLRSRPGPVNGPWADADWIFCRDGKWRPVEPGYEQMADGSASSLGRVCATNVKEIEGEINDWSIRYKTYPAESVRRVWRDLRAQALCEREIGRFSGVQSPAVLLAFLRQLTEQGWRFKDALACTRATASKVVLRVLRFDSSAARTPLRRELAEQLSGQPADPLQELSSILAHHAAQCWGEACREKAGAASFPLTHGAPGRVGRLRGYGNAINAEAARIFIETAMESI